MSDIVIVSGARTPMGGFQGSLASVAAVDLGAAAIREAVKRAGIEAADVQEVIMGCVLPAGLKQGPARQASLNAGLPAATGCTTINKLCGSGMKAVMQAHDALKAGSASIMVAGGMESMSNAPYIIEKARSGLRTLHIDADLRSVVDYPSVARDVAAYGQAMFAWWAANGSTIERGTEERAARWTMADTPSVASASNRSSRIDPSMKYTSRPSRLLQ